MDGRINVVLCRDGVRREKVNDLSRAESRVAHTREDLVRWVRRERDQTVGRDDGVVRAASKELEARAANTVADADSTGELDAVRAKN